MEEGQRRYPLEREEEVKNHENGTDGRPCTTKEIYGVDQKRGLMLGNDHVGGEHEKDDRDGDEAVGGGSDHSVLHDGGLGAGGQLHSIMMPRELIAKYQQGGGQQWSEQRQVWREGKERQRNRGGVHSR